MGGFSYILLLLLWCNLLYNDHSTAAASESLMTVSPSSIHILQDCHDGWYYNNQTSACYRILHAPSLSNVLATEKCRKLNASLLYLENLSEQKSIREMIKSSQIGKNQPGEYHGFWMDGTDSLKEGTWTYREKTVPWPSDIDWEKGQPDNGGRWEHCVTILINGNLNDVWCDVEDIILGAICKVPMGKRLKMHSNGNSTLPMSEPKGVRKDIFELEQKLRNPSTNTVDSALYTLTNLTKPIAGTASINGRELKIIMLALEHIAAISGNISISANQTQAFVDTISNLLNTENAESWQSISRDNQQTDEPIRLLSTVSTYLDEVAQSIKNDSKPIKIEASNLVLQVGKITNASNLTFPGNGQNGDTTNSVFVPAESLHNSSMYSVIVYNNLTGILSSKSDFGFGINSYDMNSAVISVKLDGWRSNAKFKLKLTFRYLQTYHGTPVCTFWDDSRKIWNNCGCVTVTSINATVVCECDHLTNFAILMNPWGQPNVSSATMRIMTLTGCIISVVCLSITVGVYSYLWRFLKKNVRRRFTIITNLSIALILSYVLFLGGVDETKKKTVCTVIAALLHYINLVVFFIMLVWGIDITMILLSIVPKLLQIKWTILVAWCLPAVIVVISIGITQLEGYGNDNNCWLSVHTGLIWAFVGPAITIIIINTLLLVVVMKTMFSVDVITRKSKLEKTKVGIRGLMSLLPVMGCTWGIGILYINEDMAWSQYAFALCNGLQGFVLFIFNCVFDKQIWLAFKQKTEGYSATNRLSDTTKVSEQRGLPKQTLPNELLRNANTQGTTAEEYPLQSADELDIPNEVVRMKNHGPKKKQTLQEPMTRP